MGATRFSHSLTPPSQVMASRLTRRALFKRGISISVGVPVVGGLLAACGGTSSAPRGEESGGGEVSTSTTTAVGTADEGSESEPTGEIVFIEGTDVTAFDPQFITDTPTIGPAYLLYDSLLTYNENLEVQPLLATKWEIADDNLTWTFYLREGATFSDGTPVTADDVVFTFTRIKDPDVGTPYRAIYEIVEEISAIDETTVQFKTSGPFPDLLMNVAGLNAAILSRQATEKFEVSEYGRNPTGCGPFVIEEWVPGDRVSFVPNPNYWGEKAKVARITYRAVPEAATRSAMVRTGEADIAVKISPEELDSLRSEPGVTILEKVSMYQISFELNCAHTDPPLNNQKIRQALNYAVDKEAIVNNILQGLGEPIVSPFGPGIQYRAEFPPYEYDPERAKSLLAEAGYPNGFRMVLWSPDGRYLKDRQVAEAVQGYLQAIGIQCELQIWEWAPYTEALRRDESRQAVMVGRATPGADYTATRLFSKASWGQYNTTNFSDPTIEELLVKGRTTFDEEERAEIYRQIQQIWWEQAPWIFLHNQRAVIAMSEDVEGFQMWPQEVMVLRYVSKK